MKKKVLIITYYWPPAGGPGVQRWLKFVKYLPEFNVEPIIYIPENPNYPLLDSSLNAEVPKGLKVLKQPIKEPYSLAGMFSKNTSKRMSKGIISEKENQSLMEKLMLWIRGNFFIPDARVSWVKPSVGYLSEYLSQNGINTIITTGPPHSLHLIGKRLKQNHDINWIADFRDPWTTIGYHKELRLTNRAANKHKVLEKEVLQTADNIIVTSEVTKMEFEAITSKPITVITNGFDYERVEETSLDSKFSLAHIGSLLSKRNPEILWKVLSELVEENKAFAQDLELKFIGAISDNVIKSIERYHLSDYLNYYGYISHNEAIKKQRESQILLLIEIDSEETKCIIPGKLFEYMVSNRPIIALGPKGSDVERIITESNTGNYFYYDTHKSLKETILRHYEAYQKGELKSQPIGVQRYHRKTLTEALAKLL
ncbi:glycosyltransferase family protein [Gaetbulibacter aestuarii]|uniref:Glycosyl transferase family 1 n=1 Tax=Gaetbulibacter aestuarii TaxID=1502358 RepID=A0ABW7N4A5_9FLAO